MSSRRSFGSAIVPYGSSSALALGSSLLLFSLRRSDTHSMRHVGLCLALTGCLGVVGAFLYKVSAMVSTIRVSPLMIPLCNAGCFKDGSLVHAHPH